MQIPKNKPRFLCRSADYNFMQQSTAVPSYVQFLIQASAKPSATILINSQFIALSGTQCSHMAFVPTSLSSRSPSRVLVNLSHCPVLSAQPTYSCLAPRGISLAAKRSKCPLYIDPYLFLPCNLLQPKVPTVYNDQYLFLPCTRKLYLPKVQITVLRYRTPHVMYLHTLYKKKQSSRLDKAVSSKGPNVKCTINTETYLC